VAFGMDRISAISDALRSNGSSANSSSTLKQRNVEVIAQDVGFSFTFTAASSTIDNYIFIGVNCTSVEGGATVSPGEIRVTSVLNGTQTTLNQGDVVHIPFIQ
jgi:hypothetical protein